MQKKKRAFTSHRNANFQLPHDLSHQLLEKLKQVTPSFKKDYLFSNVVSKFVSSDTLPSEVRRTRAISKWLATERNNEATNVRLLTVDPEFNILPRVTYVSFMQTVQRFCEDIVGEVVPEIVLNGLFSGGASTSRPRTVAHPGDKYCGKADVTSPCLQLFDVLLEDSPVWSLVSDPIPRVVEGNVLFVVPKTADIDRCACKEPDINMYLQKGVGDYLCNRLRKFGIDLNDQSRNQSLARAGSIDGSLATIDLSSASDSISRELVFQCIPILWYSFLNDLRSRITIIDGEVHVNEMFSSMGNGFTFELETMLFYAIARAVAYHTGTPGVISVYGDDIIVPTEICQDLIYALSFLGFETNKAKTFCEGSFRESCGGHYISGSDVTPFFIRRPIDNLHDTINIANQLRKWAQIGDTVILDCDVEESWRLLAEKVPKCFWGGHDLNDSSRLVSDFQPDKPKFLSPLERKRRQDHGTYVYWHNLKDRSPGADLEVSTIPTQVGIYRAKSVRYERRRTDFIFLTELKDR
jgi:hypothetical protein